MTAAVIWARPNGRPPQFVDFAVRRRIHIIETDKQGWFARGKTYLLELVDPAG